MLLICYVVEFRVENGLLKYRSVPFSIFDPIVSVFTKNMETGRKHRWKIWKRDRNIDGLFRSFLRDLAFIWIEPVFIL